MDYEKKYRDALSWMRSVYPTLNGMEKEDAEHFFPELIESDDKRIWEAIVHEFERASNSYLIETYGLSKDKFLAYLEKQEEPVCLDDGGAPSKQKCGDCTIACSVRVEEEPDKDLEEAAEKFARCYDQGTCDGIAQDCFIAGAKWQAEQDDRDVVFWKGMRYAIKGMKEDAVNGIYTKSIDGKNVFVESGALKIDPASVKVGDPVHIIVLPKEDEK